VTYDRIHTLTFLSILRISITALIHHHCHHHYHDVSISAIYTATDDVGTHVFSSFAWHRVWMLCYAMLWLCLAWRVWSIVQCCNIYRIVWCGAAAASALIRMLLISIQFQETQSKHHPFHSIQLFPEQHCTSRAVAVGLGCMYSIRLLCMVPYGIAMLLSMLSYDMIWHDTIRYDILAVLNCTAPTPSMSYCCSCSYSYSTVAVLCCSCCRFD
jgi:hypothetical protein